MLVFCDTCGGEITPQARADAGYTTCKSCGERQAVQARTSWCVAPMHKSNYLLITDKQDLKGINNKGGFHNDY